ncbi:uncharacterized protein LOC127278447, partial [Leptopilina boulardi]|uniref:uncharacterized protein LOC127278447 n=1 Tax=Leptopilina boulardi TaxID=63433 RepID=UPI0021F5A511
KSVNYNFDFAIQYNRWSMQLCGLWPIDDHWNETSLSEESKIVMISNLKRAKTLSAVCTISIYGVLIIFSIRPLMKWGDKFSQQLFPCDAYYPYNATKSPNYELTYLSQIIFFYWTVTAATAINTFLTAIVFHLCGQLQVIGLNVKYIASSRNILHFRSIIRDCKCLHCIVERHLNLIRNSEFIESSFNIMILMEVVITVMSLCIQGYAVSPAAHISETFINIAYFFAPTFLIFLYAYIGENVIDRSIAISDQVYDINWQDCNPNVVRSLIMIIIRSQRPLIITAGKFFPMSLHAFKKGTKYNFDFAAQLNRWKRIIASQKEIKSNFHFTTQFNRHKRNNLSQKEIKSNFAAQINRWRRNILTQEERKYNFDFAVQLNRWSMRLCGLWPIDDRFSKLRFYITLIIILCTCLPIIVKCLLVKDFFKEVETIFMGINFTFTFVRVIFVRMAKPKLVSLLQDMIVDWNDIPSKKELKYVMIENLKRARFLNALCMALMYSPYILFIIRPLMGWGMEFSQKSLPLPVYYPFDIQKSPNYELAYLLQIFLTGYTVTIVIGINNFLTIIVFHLCGQLQVVALNVKQIMNTRNVSHIRTMIRQECKCLRCTVERHLKLIRDSEVLESSFNIMFLMEFVISIISLCFVGFSVLVVSPVADISGTCIKSVYFFAATVLIFLYNYIGENVINRSMAIGDKVYDIDWYNCNPKLIRSLMLIIIRSQKPLKLTAGKFFPMSLFTFKSIFMSALSYATVLQAIYRNRHH